MSTDLSHFQLSPMQEVPPSPPPSPPRAPPLPSFTPGASRAPSILVQKLMSCSRECLRSPSPSEYDNTTRLGASQKTVYFFYGTLKEPTTLSHVLDTPVTSSDLHPAYVVGYAREMWGQCQALVNSPTGAIIEGAAYELQNDVDAEKIAAYETNAYKAVPCIINIGSEHDDLEPRKVQGMTFMYAGDPQALREGLRDRELWMRNMGMKKEMHICNCSVS